MFPKSPPYSNSSPSHVHIPHLELCVFFFQTRFICTCHSNLVHHIEVVCPCPHITILPRWAEIICLPWNLVASGGQRRWNLALICTFSSSTWLHIHYPGHGRDQVMSWDEMLKIPRRTFPTSKLPGGTTVTKRSPLYLILSWTAIRTIISFTDTSRAWQAVSKCATWSTKKESGVHSSRFIWSRERLEKLTFHGTHLEKTLF